MRRWEKNTQLCSRHGRKVFCVFIVFRGYLQSLTNHFAETCSRTICFKQLSNRWVYRIRVLPTLRMEIRSIRWYDFVPGAHGIRPEEATVPKRHRSSAEWSPERWGLDESGAIQKRHEHSGHSFLLLGLRHVSGNVRREGPGRDRLFQGCVRSNHADGLDSHVVSIAR